MDLPSHPCRCWTNTSRSSYLQEKMTLLHQHALEFEDYVQNATLFIHPLPSLLLKPSLQLLYLLLRLQSWIHHPTGTNESLPPKLSTAQFEKNYPGEVLDAHSTPSVRLWSLVHQQKVNKAIKYIPIQLRLSEHQCSAMIETRSSKPLRSEIQLLSQLCWDDTPEMDINSVRFFRDWFNRTPTPQFSGMHMYYVVCVTYKYSKLSTPRLQNTPLFNSIMCVCGLWSELPPNRQRREVGAAKAAAPAAKSARASSKQRPQLTTPWRREALGARPPPGTNSPTANQRQPGVRKGGTPKQTTPAKPKGKPTKTWPPKGPQEGANENVTTSREGAHGRNQSKQGSQTKQKNTTATYWYTAVQIDCCTSINQLCTKAMSTLWFVTTQPYREDRNSAGLGTKRGRWTHSQATWSNVPSSVQLSQMQAVEG